MIQGVPKRYDSMGAFIVRTLQEAGPGGFFRGASTALFMIAPQMGISFAVYEGVKRWKPTVVSATNEGSDITRRSSSNRGESDGRGEWSTTERSRQNPRESAHGGVIGVAAADDDDAAAGVRAVGGVGAEAVSSTRGGAEHEERVSQRLSSGRTGADADDSRLGQQQRQAGVRSWFMGMKTIIGRGRGKECEGDEGAVVPPAIEAGAQQQRIASTGKTAGEEGPLRGPATTGSDSGGHSGSSGGRQKNEDLGHLLVSWVEVGWPVLAGGVAGITSKLAILPMDTVKKRVQTEV